MASTINENEDFAGGQFTPFQDSDTPRVQKAIQNFASATQGYNTAIFDQYRQGVSIRTSRHLYSTTQPKLWAGNLNHAVRVVTIGQARDFTEFEDDPKFEELPEFTPQWYIEDEEYPFPIVFNNGPQQEEEAIIEPFTIPFRKANPFGNFVPRTPKANLEDGNNFENYDGGSTRVEQFIEYNQPRTPRFFLDEGAEYWGAHAAATVFVSPTFGAPTASFSFDNTLTDSTLPAYDLSLESGSLAYVPAFQTDVAVNALDFNGYTVFTGSVDPGLHLTGAMTVQGFAVVRAPDIGDIKYHFILGGDASGGESDNVLFGIYSRWSNGGFVYLHQSGASKDLTAIGGIDVIPQDEWFHYAVTRTQLGFVTIYINGEVKFAEASNPPTTGSSPAQYVQVGGLESSGVYGAVFSGSLAGLKIHDTALTAEQVFQEYASGFPYASGRSNEALQNSVKVDGYVAFIQRDADPFDDTRDEQIVEQINTTDATFISRLKELDFDLSEDIRGTFSKKSAAAGGDVYGPDSARYGTDSIAYRGLIRGS